MQASASRLIEIGGKCMKRLLGGVALMVLAVAGSACTVTVDGVNGTGNPILTTLTVVEQGQTVTFTSGHFHAIGDPGICLFGGCVSNGTVYLAEEAGSLGLPINMAKVGGFNLYSFQVAQMFNDDAAAAAGGFPNAVTVRVVGNLTGGGSVTAFCPIPNTGFAQCTLPGTFANLRSATFSGLTAGGGAAGLGIDSISYLPLAFGVSTDEDGFEATLAPSESGDPASGQ
jgi:hypothetical protein